MEKLLFQPFQQFKQFNPSLIGKQESVLNRFERLEHYEPVELSISNNRLLSYRPAAAVCESRLMLKSKRLR